MTLRHRRVIARFMISQGRFVVGLIIIIRRQLVIKLNEVLAPGHMSTLVLNKAFPIFMCRVIYVDLVVLLMNHTINADTGIPRWNWAAIDYPISRRLGLAKRHLVSCPLLTDVQPDTDGLGEVVNRMRHIRLYIVNRGRSIAAGSQDRASRNRFLCCIHTPRYHDFTDSYFNLFFKPFSKLASISFKT
jgi:hypothetical protein